MALGHDLAFIDRKSPAKPGSAYILRGKHCGQKYEANGSDIWQRKCPVPASPCVAGGGAKGTQ